ERDLLRCFRRPSGRLEVLSVLIEGEAEPPCEEPDRLLAHAAASPFDGRHEFACQHVKAEKEPRSRKLGFGGPLPSLARLLRDDMRVLHERRVWAYELAAAASGTRVACREFVVALDE